MSPFLSVCNGFWRVGCLYQLGVRLRYLSLFLPCVHSLLLASFALDHCRSLVTATRCCVECFQLLGIQLQSLIRLCTIDAGRPYQHSLTIAAPERHISAFNMDSVVRSILALTYAQLSLTALATVSHAAISTTKAVPSSAPSLTT